MMDPPWVLDYLRLHRSGWSIGDTAFNDRLRTFWLVSGRNGENLIRAEGRTQDEAWEEAIGQARAVGLCAD